MIKIRSFFTGPYLYILIVLVGVFLKFYKLDQQFFWDDEVATVLHTSGISMQEYEENIPVNQVVPKKYFDDLLLLNDRDLEFTDQFIGLAEMPQVTPGHYYYFIFITRIFGDDPIIFRLFSVILFILSIPLLFLLTRKVCKNKLAAWITISFYSVSPFFQWYAQEARYYVLWGFAIIIMHYIFLMAIERQSRLWWGLYVIVGFLAVHTTILFYITLLAHFIYIFIYDKTQWKNTLISQSLIFISSLPWLTYIYFNREDIQQALSWQKYFAETSILDLLEAQIESIISVFIYFDVLTVGDTMQTIGKWMYGILFASATFVLFKRANYRQKWFIALISFLGAIFILSIDLIREAGSSNLPRYQLLNFIGILILVGFTFQKAAVSKPLIFGSIFICMIGLSIHSSLEITNDTTYGKRADAPYYVKDANEKFSGSEKVLLITDFTAVIPNSFTTLISLFNISDNHKLDIIYAKPDYPDFSQDFTYSTYDKVYAMYASEDLIKVLREDFPSGRVQLLEERKLYGMFDVSAYEIVPK